MTKPMFHQNCMSSVSVSVTRDLKFVCVGRRRGDAQEDTCVELAAPAHALPELFRILLL